MKISSILSGGVFPSAISYLIVSLACTQFPLLNYLGYEFSTVIALLASFVAGFLTISTIKHSLNEDPNPFPKESFGQAPNIYYSAFKQALLLNLTLLVIPFVVMLTNAFFVKNCSLLEGLGFFILIPVITVVFSSALGFFCAVHYHWARTAFVGFFFSTILYTLVLGYFTPAIFSYNFFYGYFPGLTYDEALGINLTLVWFRLLTLFLAGVFVWMAVLLVKHSQPADRFWRKGLTLLRVLGEGRRLVVSCVVVLMLGLLWWFRCELGFESHAWFIQKQLGSSFETKHFTIYYAKQSYDDDEIRWIAAEHEFRLKQITDELSLPFKDKVESYVYPSSGVKQRLMGAGNTNIAKPWSGQIHITKQSLDGTLKHELAHVLVAPFGLPIINASLSTGLVEGIAMAIEWDWGNRTPHQYAAAMRKFGVAPDISSMMMLTGFASQSSSISYVLAGSFCRYLIDTYGMRSMMLAYRTNDYESSYSKPLALLIREWQDFLGRIPVSDQDRDAVDVLFRSPPIFKKVCARVIAARNQDAATKFGKREYSVAAALYRQSWDEGRGYSALSGYITSALHAREYPSVIALHDTAIRRSQNPSQYLPLLINVGLARYGTGDLAGARELFHRVEVADLGEALTEASLICSIATTDTLNRDRLLKYFLAAPNDSQRVAMLDSMVQHPTLHWLPLYLKGKVLSRLHRWNESLTTMRQLNQVPENNLEAIRLKAMGFALFRLRRFEDAKRMYWQSLNSVDTEVARNEVNEWVERCEWMKNNLKKIK